MSFPIKLDILISGGGIAGQCVAWWLKKIKNVDAQITLIERAPKPRLTGQAVDIRDAAVDVIHAMGLEQTIRDHHTTEEGSEFVYLDGVRKATFGATGDKEDQSVTSEFEIFRGELAEIFHKATEDLPGVRYVFDENMSALEEKDNGRVKVTFTNHLQEQEFDMVIGADGVMSKARRLAFGDEGGNNYLKRLGQHVCFFTIPDWDLNTKYSQWYFGAEGRLAVTRPSPHKDTRAYLAVTDSDMARFDGIIKAGEEGPDAQKKWMAEQFEGAGWLTERIVKGMFEAPDFYIQETAQVKIEQFAKGRVALVGDAGYCPTPISGVGTTCAIVGAFVLAGEIAKCPNDIPQALDGYVKTLRPFIDDCQNLPGGGPQAANPQSEFSVKILDAVIGAAASPFAQYLSSFAKWILPRSLTNKKWDLPKYDAFEELMQQA